MENKKVREGRKSFLSHSLFENASHKFDKNIYKIAKSTSVKYPMNNTNLTFLQAKLIFLIQEK